MTYYEKLAARQRELRDIKTNIQVSLDILKRGKGVIKCCSTEHSGEGKVYISPEVVKHLTVALESDLKTIEADLTDVSFYLSNLEADISSTFPYLDYDKLEETKEEVNGANF